MILVTGGTGFIGRAVVRELLRRGERVRVATRDPRRARDRFGDAVEAARADVSDEGSLSAAMDGVRVVVCAVQFPGHPVENPRKGRTYHQVDALGTERQVRAAVQAGVQRFVYVSGAGVREGRPQPWFHAKAHAEQCVRRSDMAFAIVRPSWVYGPEDTTLNRIAAMSRFLPLVPVPGSGRQRAQPIHVADLAAILADCALGGRADGMTLEAGGPEILSVREVVKTMLRVTGRRRLIVPQPVWFMKLGAFFLSALPNPPLSPGAVDFLTMDEICDTALLVDTLSPSLRRLEDGLVEYLAPGNIPGD